MAGKTITVFYAWQSDTPSAIGKNFIRKALDDAAERINLDPESAGLKIAIDADTEGLVGTPPVTESILAKIGKADIFAPDLTFVAKSDAGKLSPNPNVMIEYGYALQSLGFEAMMPVMNTHFGPPEVLPFDMGHVRHPIQYDIAPSINDGDRREARTKLSARLEDVPRVMASHTVRKIRADKPFSPMPRVRPPAFFFNAEQVIANFGNPGEQELRFKRPRAIYVRLYPTYADQPRVGLAKIVATIHKLNPMAQGLDSGIHTKNDFGAVILIPHGSGIKSFTQAFETGELWGVSEKAFRTDNPDYVHLLPMEQDCVAAIENYLKVYANVFELVPPFTLELGATGLKDRYLLVPGDEPWSARKGPILKDSISRTFELEGVDQAEWKAVIREFLIDFYDLAAISRSDVLTDGLVAAHGLPPR